MKNTFLPVLILGVLALPGCGGGTAAPAAGGKKAAAKGGAAVNPDEGKPPQRAKIPSDDLFAELVVAFVEGKASYPDIELKLDKLGAEAIPTYRDALEGGDGSSRQLACMRLAVLGPDAAPATDVLAKALDDNEAFVRANAASVLSVVSEPPQQLVPALVKILSDKSATDWHGMSIVALSNLGTDADGAVPALSGYLTSTKAEYRRDTLKTLKSIGPAAKEILPQIKPLTKDDNEEVRETAIDVVQFLESIDREEPVAGELRGPQGSIEKIGSVDLTDVAGTDGPPPPLPSLDVPKEDEKPQDDLQLDLSGETEPEPEAPSTPKEKDGDK